MSFTHLHCHSNFSLLDGAASIDRLIEAAQRFKMQALAITDHNALYAGVEFYRAAMGQGIKPILGAEVIVAGGGHLVLLARDWEGYGNLCRIITEAHLNGGGKEPAAPPGALARYARGLVCLSGCRRGEIPNLLLRGETEKAEEIAARYSDIFGPGNFFIELQWTAELSQRRLLRRLVRLAGRRRLPLVATNNVHFLKPEDYLVHRTLASIRTLKTLSDAVPGEVADKAFFLKSEAEMEAVLGEIPEALANTVKIAGRCELNLPSGEPIFPGCDVPPGEQASSYLRRLASKGLAERYRTVTGDLTERLDYELKIIHRMGFTEYFLIVWDIVRFARSKTIPAVGRGSAACSLVAYALGITDADPMRYNLSFERFLNPFRSDPPDIDLDLCWRGRDEVLAYVYEKYGRDRVAMICTYATLRLRSAFREVAKVFGLPPSEINTLAKRLPSFGVSKLDDAMGRIPECRDIPIDQEPYRIIFRISEKITGFPRHLGIHCGGIVIGREPLPTWVPLERATKGIVVTQYDMRAIEALGLVKIDLLGQRALTIVADTVRMVEENYGRRVDVDRLPEGEEKTAALIRQGFTMGCFQIESPGMRNLLQQIEAETPEDVIVALSLIRPGPAEAGMKEQFVRYRRGLERVSYLHPKMEEILGDTYGIMLYQEDILKVASGVAGLSLAEADGLRRAVTKRRSPEEMAKHRKGFMVGARRSGIPQAVSESIWLRMANFSAYSFCKAHAATYGRIAYRCCYLKAHYPAEFLAAVLTNRAGYYPASAYVEEARRWGVAILAPDVNRSREEYTARENILQIGLMRVKDLTARSLRSILRQRAHAPFGALDDFCRRVDIGRSEVENLIKCGSMDGFGRTRPELLWELSLIFEGILEEKKKAAEATLFSVPETFRMPTTVPKIPDYPDSQKVSMEQDILSLAVTCHPLALYRQTLGKEGILPSTDLPAYADRRVKVAGRLITSRRARTAGGKLMKFLTLEDVHGTFEVVLFPDAYQRHGARLFSEGPFLIRGTVRCQNGSAVLIGEDIRSLRDIVACVGHSRDGTGPSVFQRRPVSPDRNTALQRWLFEKN
ncbi:MAG: DNA polymerase III subunit alpha [Gemmatimonadota bacterium]|nr:MAG: DNA polymerase III subunit alpha [Gemmatimonadota bacterium]